MLTIRQESKKDEQEVYHVVKASFKTAEYADGLEQDLVVSLRKSDAFIKELSLVAEQDDKIVGYILFTKIKIGNDVELALAPLAVLPKYQRKQIGTNLILEGHRIATKLGYHYSVVLGSHEYYPKFGYIPASQYGIKAPFEVQDENFMAIQLKNTKKEIKGIVQYAKEFGI